MKIAKKTWKMIGGFVVVAALIAGGAYAYYVRVTAKTSSGT